MAAGTLVEPTRTNAGVVSAARVGRLIFAVVACLPLCGRGEVAAAGPLSVALVYEAASNCPGVDDFKAAVAGQLGYDPFDDDSPDRVLVRIAPRGRALEGRLEWRDPAGKWAGDKTLPSRSGDCAELARAMAFALAVQIQLLTLERMPSKESVAPDGKTTEPPAASPPPPSAPPPPPLGLAESPDAPEVTHRAQSAEVRTRPTFAVGGGGAVAVGVSPGPVPLVRLFGALAWPWLSVELGAEIGLPAITRREDGAGFAQQLFLATGAGCGTRGRFSACLLAKAGQVRIDGRDIDVPASPSAPLFEAGLRLAGVHPLGRRLSVAARAEGVANVTRWTVTLDHLPVWTSPRFAGCLGFDLLVRFP